MIWRPAGAGKSHGRCLCEICAAGALEPDESGAPSLARRPFLAGLATAFAAAPLVAHAAPTRRTRTTPLVLEPSWVLAYQSGNLTLLRDHSVVIQGDRIAEIIPGRVKGTNARLAMPGQLLLPGLISSHTHVACGSPTRGLIESGGRSYAPVLAIMETLDDEDLDALTAYNLAEILRAGCTTQIEQSISLKLAKSYVRVASRWGVRGFPGGMTPGWSRLIPIWRRTQDSALFDSVPETLREVEANLQYALSINGAEEGRIVPMMTPHGPETHTAETLRAVALAAKQLGNGVHTHLATSDRDSAIIKRLWGKGPVQWIDEFGFYDQRLFGAHLGGWDVTSDPAFLAKKPLFSYAHCPSGAGAGSGQANQPFIEALGAGLNTTIGIDTHSNDMVENMKLAVLYGRARFGQIGARSPTPVRSPTVMDMVRSATLNPANGLGRTDLGRIAVGAKADLTSIDLSDFLVGAGTTPREPLNNILYANGQSVRHVFTDGVAQVRDGRLIVDDPARVRVQGARVVEKIWDQLQADGWFKLAP
ncbi:MAG: amidohydrolase family protein [Pseudomonadota bacterium]